MLPFSSLFQYLFAVSAFLMAKAGGCFFQIGYFLYTRTRIGYWYHQKEISRARQKLGHAGHSKTDVIEYQDLSILPIPMLLDNYAYLITDKSTNTSVIIDPGDPEPVQLILDEKGITPEALIITHKHWDHSGGNGVMKNRYRNLRIYGGAMDHVPNITNPVADGDILMFGSLKFHAMFTPGHTVGHIVYLLDGSPFGVPNSLFSGDHVFLSGCGRMFEGSSSTMLRSLDSICSLGDDVLVWPGHEYASDNLEFSLHLEKENCDAQEKYEWVKNQRDNNLPTCPSTIGEEKKYNPFLRTGQESLLHAIGLCEGDNFEHSTEPGFEIRAQALAEVRSRKDLFKYKL
ncbi:probable hydrolase PNKD [Gigantopelta aegis]|uniref:probable hydrolase PNKD n=1 Tax=Gigantopelta aegis TaxID=1735272 RepID=UPI001B88D626|nr:probable hydrolase PNKD [Gigantopelta aegis]